MKYAKVLLAALYVFCCSNRAHADTVGSTDPKIIARAPGSPGEGAPPFGIIGPDLTVMFTSPSGTSGDNLLPGNTFCQVNGMSIFECDFINDSGVTLSNLSLTLNPGAGVDLTCTAAFGFTNACEVVLRGGLASPTVLFFSGGPGIADGSGIGFTLNGWAADTQLIAAFNTPEPGTGILLLGVAPLLIGRALQSRIVKR